MENLREEILKLSNPTPVFKDPEDNSDDDTAARLETPDEVDDFDPETHAPSKLRRSAANHLVETDIRYAGKKTSRKDLEDDVQSGDFDLDEEEEDDSDDGNSDEEDSSDNAEDSEVGVDDDDITEFQSKVTSKSDTKEFIFTDDGDYGKYGGVDDDEDNEDEDDDDDSDEEGDDDDDDNEESLNDTGDEESNSEDEGIQKFSSAAMDDVSKGQSAQQQLGLWDSLLEGRIKLQKAVSIINQIPQHTSWGEFTERSEQFTDEAVKTQQVLKHLLDSLAHLQDLLLMQNSETKHMMEDDAKSAFNSQLKEDEDEEIPSDSEEEEIEEKKDAPSKPAARKRKLKLDEYPGFLKKRHDDFLSYRNTTIQKWFDKTRLAGGKVKGKSFNAFDQSALAQINQILGDKDRLIKRSQLKRSIYRVFGTQPKIEDPEAVPTDSTKERLSDREHLKDYNEEIFDDDDFYHQMLRELIEKKTSDISDPVALSRQWLEIQKLRTKSKKNIDTKASKGRKVRYEIHKKLVNFMAPLDNCEWSHEAKDDMFKSLFGKRFTAMDAH